MKICASNLHDPIAALSPAICNALGSVGLVLVPYLEKGNGRTGDMVSFDKPAEGRQLIASRTKAGDMTILVLATAKKTSPTIITLFTMRWRGR